MVAKVDLIYIEGEGNIVESLKKWDSNESVISETSKTFSGQVFDFCKKNKLNTLAISYYKERISYQTKGFAAFSKPRYRLKGSLGYMVSQFLTGLRVLMLGLRYQPKYLHINNGITFFFMLAPLQLFNIHIIPHFHNTFWAKGFPPTSKAKKLFIKADAWFLKHIASSVVCCSPEIKEQIIEITRGRQCPTYIFKAQFYRKDFDNPLPPPAHNSKPFIVVFAGRIERDKGVFDILKIAEKLDHHQIIFHICGSGSALDDLKQALTEMPHLKDTVTIHGRLNRPALLDIYTKGHAVIVPTTSDFCEGLPMVAIESVLLGRPVITSKLSNALDVLGAAIVEAEPENINSYARAITLLSSNASLYKQKQASCHALREQFLNGKSGLDSLLNRTLIQDEFIDSEEIYQNEA